MRLPAHPLSVRVKRPSPNPARNYTRLAFILAIAIVSSSCTVVGPKAISSGRLAYNQAIADTNNQQMLMVLVNNRYNEQASMLAVASITANVSVKSSAGFEAGFGSDSNYAGNLVPFSGGVIYEENPTISYTPVAGETYLRQLTSPLPMVMLAQIARTMTDPKPIFIALVSSVNGIYNPDFIFNGEEDDTRFDRFADIVTELTRAHRLHWVLDAAGKEEFSILVDQAAPEHAALVKELLTLLGLSDRYHDKPRIVIPVTMSLNGAEEGYIGMTTRSIHDMLEILAARVAVPQQDLDNGVASSYPPSGRLGRELAIHYSEDDPEYAYVKVRHRGGWFYIDERDTATKRYFKLLGGLWALAVARSVTDGPAAPVLTVPVSN